MLHLEHDSVGARAADGRRGAPTNSTVIVGPSELGGGAAGAMSTVSAGLGDGLS
jgi:hypothetical protein